VKYQVGSIGKTVVVRFEDGDDILGGLSEIVKAEEVRAAVFFLVGGIKEGRIVVGPETDYPPPKPVWREIVESHESLGVGTIFRHGDEPRIHFHGAYGKHDMAKIGCLRELASTFLVMEAVVMELTGITATRELDALTNMVLLKIPEEP
jgi:predicted DNA-binding protein with PD1-like motif